MTQPQARVAAQPRTRAPLLLLGSALLIALSTPLIAQETTESEQEVSFVNRDGKDIGTAKLTGTPVGLLIALDLENLTPETWHGFHIHETGECDPETGFKSAGGHFAISDTSHGFHVEGGPHSGDMPNQYVSADGILKAHVLNNYAFLGGDMGNVSGRALVLHSGPDDYKSQPSGAAGDRIACAVIE